VIKTSPIWRVAIIKIASGAFILTYFRAIQRIRGYKLAILFAWLAVVGLLLFGLGDAPLTDIDEGAFAEASREMLSRRDWISPWLYDAPRFDKPVLIHWLQMVSFEIFELSSWSARLPSALAGIIWIAAIAAWARAIAQSLYYELDADGVYFWTLVSAGTSIGIIAISRAATADALLNALLTLSLLALWKAFYGEEDGLIKFWARVCAAAVGFGLITKGPIAVLIPAVALLLAAFSKGRAGLSRTKQLLVDPMSWALPIIISLPWYWLQYQAQGLSFLHSFLGDHNIGRFTSTMHGFSAGPWYYPIWISVALLPTSVFGFRIVKYFLAQRLWRNRPLWVCWGVFLFVILFFSASATKLPHYGFYGLSGLLVVVGVILTQITKPDRCEKIPKFIFERILASLMLIALGSLPFWWSGFAELPRDIYIRTVLQEAGNIYSANQRWFIFAGVGFMLPLLFRHLYAIAATSFAITATLYFGVVTPLIKAMRVPIYNAAQVVKPMAESVITWRLAAPSLSFAAGKVIPPGEPSRNMYVVLHSKDQQELNNRLESRFDGPVPLRLVWEEGGVRVIYVQ
jgi:4-amino-4-deoxy-L-arabinose transferase-like glycosyltransferase